MRSTSILSAFLLACAIGARAQEPIGEPLSLVEKVYTLDDAEHLALLNDARLLSAEQQQVIAAERVREAKFLFLPEVGLQASGTKYNANYPFSLSGDFRNILLFPGNQYATNTGTFYSGRAYMNMSLYDGGRTLSTLRLAQAAAKQANTTHDSIRMDILMEVKEVFYRLLLAQDRLKAADQYRSAVDDLLRKASLPALERIEAEARLSAARAESAEAEHQLDLRRLAFLKSLNVELDTPFRVEGALQTKPVDIDIEKAALWAIELRPELQSETYKAQMDAISVNLAQARRLPTVFLAGDYELADTDFPLRQNNWDATVGLKLPFSYDYWSQIKQRRAEQRQGQIKRSELQDRVRLEVRQAYEDLEYWQREFPLREAEYRKVQAIYDAAGSSGTALERIGALQSLLDLKLSYEKAVTEHIIALAKLERAVGRDIAP